MAERWKPVHDFPGYEVSDHGRIRSKYLGKEWKIRKPGVIQHGYHNISMRRDGKNYTRTIHRLVLTAFDRLPGPGEVCRHLDGNPQNNHINNLKWGTYKENTEDRRTHGTIYSVRLTDEQIKDIVYLNGIGAFKSEIAAKHRITACVVDRVLRNSSKS